MDMDIHISPLKIKIKKMNSKHVEKYDNAFYI
jgi:hypothetical protein